MQSDNQLFYSFFNMNELARLFYVARFVFYFLQVLCSFSSAFSRLETFPQLFWQVKEWLIIKLHEMIRVPLVVASPIVFILYHDQGWQEGVLKVMKKDHFLVFLIILVLLSKFLGRSRSSSY